MIIALVKNNQFFIGVCLGKKRVNGPLQKERLSACNTNTRNQRIMFFHSVVPISLRIYGDFSSASYQHLVIRQKYFFKFGSLYLLPNIKTLKMKKLKLKALNLGAHEVLTREQLKTVTGGVGFFWACECPDGVNYLCDGTLSSCLAKSASECGAGNTATCSQTSGLL